MYRRKVQETNRKQDNWQAHCPDARGDRIHLPQIVGDAAKVVHKVLSEGSGIALN